ncbi:Mrp/NBP35 family ATP-binding protein [Moraxella sp. ZJ142]|uniref:Mrp/NBP35 family ATP-binding protein n=1 Tax=Moraxella marmotae TaxID=3344520 RepID=UPI0035D4919F
MFNLFKKKKSKNEQVQAVLDGMTLYHQPFMTYVEKLSLTETTLDLQMKIGQTDDTAELEREYHQLQQTLYPMGIEEVNIHVTVVADNDVQADNSPKTAHNHAKTNAVQSYEPPKNTIPTDDGKDAAPSKPAPKQSELLAHPRIANIIVVASGKGGVGKSTTTVNLALALQKLGKRVGVLDADIYGPSIPTMLGVAGIKPVVENDQFVPIDANGLAVLSIGNLIESDDVPIAWRGIKATGALMQLYGQTNWPQLDYLLIDMPPGTGDIQLTLAQRIPVTGAVVVTTPQHIALLDAKKGVEMFNKTSIPVLGIVENMALHTCSNCGHTEAVFGTGGGDQIAQTYGVPLLGQLPLDAKIRQSMDSGAVEQLNQANFAVHYQEIAKKIDASVGRFAKKTTDRFF